MKRMLVLMLIMVMTASSVLAEEIDFANMDLADLLALHERLDEAIQDAFECELDENNLYQGVYVVGKDIKAGYYLLTSLNKTYFMCHLYENEAHKEKHEGGQHETLLNIGDTLSIHFEDGMVFVVDQGVVAVKESENPQWAPQ